LRATLIRRSSSSALTGRFTRSKRPPPSPASTSFALANARPQSCEATIPSSTPRAGHDDGDVVGRGGGGRLGPRWRRAQQRTLVVVANLRCTTRTSTTNGASLERGEPHRAALAERVGDELVVAITCATAANCGSLRFSELEQYITSFEVATAPSPRHRENARHSVWRVRQVSLRQSGAGPFCRAGAMGHFLLRTVERPRAPSNCAHSSDSARAQAFECVGDPDESAWRSRK